MSRLLSLLIANSSATTGGGTGGEGGGGGGTPAAWAWPTTADTTLTTLRPYGSPLTTRRVGTWADHQTPTDTALVDALVAAQTTINNTIPYGQSGPQYHGDLLLAPGIHAGGQGAGGWRNIVGVTGNPADVTISSDSTAADGVLHPYGASYIEGVTLKAGYNAGANTSPKYCAHIGGGAVTTFANVTFDASAAVPGGATNLSSGTVGMDGSPGTILLFYKCSFLKPPGLSGAGMNLHGASPGLEPITVMFVDCTLPDGASFGGPGASDGQPDRLYVIGGTLGGSITANATTHVYTDHPGSVTGTTHGVTTTTTWPTYTGGLTGDWATYYTPSVIGTSGTSIIKASVTDAAPMSLTPGRLYYCPVPISHAAYVNRHGVTVRSVGTGTWRIGFQIDLGISYGSPYFRNYPRHLVEDVGAPITPPALGSPPTVGQLLKSYYYDYAMYPGSTSHGSNRAWVALTVDAAAQVDGSSQLVALHDCYYSDDGGTTLTKATTGPFPLAHVAQVL